jgi:CRP-like cAMP-binding protein
MNDEISIALEIFKDFSFSEEEIQFINTKFKKIELSKGMTLLKPNIAVEHQYYTYSGCLRSYFVHKSGKENTMQFAVNDWWISDYTSFFSSEKSIMSIECIQDAVIYRISKSDLEELYREIPKVESFFRVKLERAFAGFQRRILEYLTLSARERYVKFVDNYPKIVACIRNYHIASYLGITTESLSRIRKLTS